MRRCSWLLLPVALVVSGACSSGGGSGGSGSGCNEPSDCSDWHCTCNDNYDLSVAVCASHRCEDGPTACGSVCKSHGGVASITENETVKDSAECDAYCAKLLSLGCGDVECDRLVHCGVPHDSCPEAKRAELQCVADTGTWKCEPGGGWSVTSSCTQSSSACGDGG